MTERTVTVNGVQLTEGQVREAMARLSAQTTSYKGGDIVLRDGDRDDRWVVLSEYVTRRRQVQRRERRWKCWLRRRLSRRLCE